MAQPSKTGMQGGLAWRPTPQSPAPSQAISFDRYPAHGSLRSQQGLNKAPVCHSSSRRWAAVCPLAFFTVSLLVSPETLRNGMGIKRWGSF